MADEVTIVWTLLPEIVLTVAAFASLPLTFRKKSPAKIINAVALASLLAAAFLTADMMGLRLLERVGVHAWTVPADLPELRLRIDLFSLFFHMVFLGVAILVVIASRAFIKPEEPHQGEYYALLNLSVVGMMFTAMATDLFVLYLAFEFSSLCTFALVAFRKQEKRGTEAALKFFIIGALSSALILFGISLFYGISGTTSIGATTDLVKLNLMAPEGVAGFEPALVLAIVLVLAGFGFKVAAAPFHMWAPDVYEGAPSTITAVLSAASKKMGFVALFKIFLVGLLAVKGHWVFAVAIIAVATMTWGNVAALTQRNIKRMLAYSSIAQAGYILIALVVATDPNESVRNFGVAGGMYHILTHAIMKGGAFLAVAAAATVGIGEVVDNYRGLARRNKLLAFSMAVFLLSLAGIPPLGGFFSKFVLFFSAVNAGNWMVWLAVAGVLNSALSLYYYARVVRFMYIVEPEVTTKLRPPAALMVAVTLAMVATWVTGIFAEPFVNYLLEAAPQLFA